MKLSGPKESIEMRRTTIMVESKLWKLQEPRYRHPLPWTTRRLDNQDANSMLACLLQHKARARPRLPVKFLHQQQHHECQSQVMGKKIVHPTWRHDLVVLLVVLLVMKQPPHSKDGRTQRNHTRVDLENQLHSSYHISSHHRHHNYHHHHRRKN